MKVKKLLPLVMIISAILVSCDKEEEQAVVPDGYINGVVLKDSVEVDSFALAFAGNFNPDGYSKDCAYSAVSDSLKIGVETSGKWSFLVRVKLPGTVGMGLFDIEENSGTYLADSFTKGYSTVEGELHITHSTKIKEPNGRKDYFIEGKLTTIFADSVQPDTLILIANFDNIRVRAE